MWQMEKCPDCESERALGPNCGDGKCSECHGTGLEQDLLEALGEALMGESQKCKVCGGTGTCQTCFGKGYLEV